MTTNKPFEGFGGRTCGEHRSVGYRAWCHDCGMWCYPSKELRCPGCAAAWPACPTCNGVGYIDPAIPQKWMLGFDPDRVGEWKNR